MFDLRCVHRGCVVIPFEITVTAGAPSLTLGGQWLTVSDDGTGDFTLTMGSTYGSASARALVPIGLVCDTSTTNELIVNVISRSTTAINIEVNDDAGTATDPTIISGALLWFATSQPE